jgi:hypothetical protein
MTVLEMAYHTGRYPATPGVLSRFLPPHPDEVASAWLYENILAGMRPENPPWILDPFGASPRLAVEAARAGCRVLTTVNNPVARFLLEIKASAPTRSELVAALADLASSFRGEERIEPHIRGLYNSVCRNCGKSVEAASFLWERQATVPFMVSYSCSNCGYSGDQEITPIDIENARRFSARGLHQARALERIAPAGDPDRHHAEEALSMYLPRAVYVLFTLANKVEGLTLPPERRNNLYALLLHAFDQGNVLWAHASGRERPKQFNIPARFREFNLWQSLEQGIDLWASENAPVPLTHWPDLPEAGGICLFEGRLKDLSFSMQQDQNRRIPISAVIAALPRPNQAYWTLCALWAGWLWGRSAIGPFKSVLRRRRYDWSWHTTALFATLNNLTDFLVPGTPFLGLTPEAEPNFLTAILVAADMAGFDLKDIALLDLTARAGIDQAQTTWEYSGPIGAGGQSWKEMTLTAGEEARLAIQHFLESAGQPMGFLPSYTAGLAATIKQHFYRRATPEEAGESVHDLREPEVDSSFTQPMVSPSINFTQANNLLRSIFSFRSGFVRYGSGESIEAGLWYPQVISQHQHPLYDRVEKALVNYMIKNSNVPYSELETYLVGQFRGLLTPSPELIQVCLNAYCIQEAPESDQWTLRSEDTPTSRRNDLAEVSANLNELAHRMGFAVQGQRPLCWMRDDKIVFQFYLIASAVIGEIILSPDQTPEKEILSIIVLPGGRANLVAYKVNLDARLRALISAVETGAPEQIRTKWFFLKFRHLRWLLNNSLATPENFINLVQQDPLTYTAPQMRLF